VYIIYRWVLQGGVHYIEVGAKGKCTLYTGGHYREAHIIYTVRLTL